MGVVAAECKLSKRAEMGAERQMGRSEVEAITAGPKKSEVLA